jgi:hypothetical protein
LILPIRKPSHHRLFTPSDLERIRCIRETINTKKVSIAGIQHLLALIPCWSIHHCPETLRNACPAFNEISSPCWMVKDKPGDCGIAVCRSCEVYNMISDCTHLKKTIARCIDGKEFYHE